MSNVIKWNSLPAIEQEMLNFPKTEWVRASDHERVVAELKADVTKQTEWKEAFMSLAEGEIPLNERWKQECLYRDQTIATQAKVIEVLKACIQKEDHRCGIWHDGRKAIEQAETIERGEA